MGICKWPFGPVCPVRSFLIKLWVELSWVESTKFNPNRSTRGENITSYRFLKMAAAAAQYYFRCLNCWCHFFKKSNSIIKPNVVDIAQLRSYILLPFWKKKRPPYWNSTSSFDFDYITIIGMLFCINLPNIIYIRPPIAEI